MPLTQQIYCKENNTCFSVPLEKRKVIKKTLARTFGLFIILIIFGSSFIIPFLMGTYGAFTGFADFYILLVILVLAVIFLLVDLFQCLYYRYYFYDLTSEEIVIKKGVVSRREITLPYSKIQNVYVDQDVLDRIFRLYDVHLETAGLGSGMTAHIDGVSEANMNKLRDMLVAKTKKNIGSGV